MENFSYNLPEENIAKYPLKERDQSRLLIYQDRSLSEDIYRNIARHLPEGSLLVFNNTRVVEARLFFRKVTGGVIEIFALEPHDDFGNVATAMKQKGNVWWKCLIGGAGKWKRGQVMQKQLDHAGEHIHLAAEIVEKYPDYFTVQFSWTPPTLTFEEILHLSGVIPIPPYLKRETEVSDLNRYQTVYASQPGSVAAPTAGLHFTENVFNSLKTRRIETEFVTLHVSAGTFMPVKSHTLAGHQMHAEYINITPSVLQKLIDRPQPVFAVGTTSLRTLESIYWMGVKCFLNPAIGYEELSIKQWEVYESLDDISIDNQTALQALLNWMKVNSPQNLLIKTRILIAPPYQTKMIRGLVTNFHQPNSTLLLLVAAIIGEEWKKVYEYALSENFRFLSYGDGCLLYLH
jgi:S-adenosylmethionine:tRNA ribosyltransferase-isomerase